MSQPILPIYQRIFSLFGLFSHRPILPICRNPFPLYVKSRRHWFEGIFGRLPRVKADDAQAGFERVYKDGRAALSRAEAEAKAERLTDSPSKRVQHTPHQKSRRRSKQSLTLPVFPLSCHLPCCFPCSKKTNPSRIDPTTSLSSDLVFST